MTSRARPAETARPTIAIVGGGFSGAALAYQLASRRAPARIVVFEPRERLGVGLAYDTDEPSHRINVPADRMSFIPGDDQHFARWIREGLGTAGDREATLEDGRVFARRSLFGAYVAAQIAPYLADGAIEHVRCRVSSIEPSQGWWRIQGDGHGPVLADIVVIATTHPPPTLPRALAKLAADPRIIADALAPGWADAIGADDRVLVVGTGLTMADAIATIDRRGHRGPILALSRRGLRSRTHTARPADPFGDFLSEPATTALELLGKVRRAVAAAAAEGRPWQAVFDTLRIQGPAIWAALDVRERRQLVRHLRPFWDVHRFRIAPMVNDVIERRIESNRLTVLAARLTSAEAEPDGIRVTLQPRRRPGPIAQSFDRIIVTTGPGHADILTSQPALAGLHAAKRLDLDPVGLGLHCDRRARILDHAGEPVPGLYLAGPLARGTFGELMGLPQVSQFAPFLAEIVLEALVQTRAA